MDPCKSCGALEFVPYKTPRDLSLIQCSHCGLVALEIASDPISYLSSMEDKFFSDEFIESHDWFQRWLSRRKASRRILEIIQYKRSGDLLEIGPGAGDFLSAAKQQGFRCHGIEMSEPLANHIAAEIGVQMRVGSFEDLPSWCRKFDIVVMSHVLEHFHDPVVALRLIHSVIHSDSMIYIAVPNLASWLAKLSGWKPYLPYHLYYFNPQTLISVLESAGFEAFMIETFQDLPGWPLTIARSLVKARRPLNSLVGKRSGEKRKVARMLWDMWNITTVFIGCGITPLRWFQGWCKRGDELVVMARPKFCPNTLLS